MKCILMRRCTWFDNSPVRILQDASHTFTGFHLYYPHRNISPALRCVVERLREG